MTSQISQYPDQDYFVKELASLENQGANFTPIKYGEKLPLEKSWQKNPKTLSQISLHDRGIGILLGYGNLLSIDIDNADGCQRFINYFHCFPCDYPSVSWSSGKNFDNDYSEIINQNSNIQILFKLTDSQATKIQGRQTFKNNTLDLRWHGCQSVLPSLSPHPDTGKSYIWHHAPSEYAIAQIPGDIFDAIITDVKSKSCATKNKGKGLLSFLKGWFKDDPIGATAGGALVLIVGGIIVTKGAIIGAIGGGGLAAIAQIGAAGSAIGTAVKVAASFAFKNKIISFIGTTLFGGIVSNSASYLSNVQFVYNFDWNISVESIRASQQAAMMRVVNQLGETAGMALGGLVCSALPGMAQVEINPEIFARTWYLIRDHVKEEILDSYAELILATKNAAKFMAFLETFKNTRDFIRNNVRTGLKGIDDNISKWGLEGKPWILSEKVEEAIESIPNDKVREFTENVLDGFIETCGMIYPQMNVISV